MRDAMLGGTTAIPSYGYAMCFSTAVLAYVFGTIVFERQAHRAVVNV